MKEIDPRTLRNDLLRQVSRSFFLSMRFLPKVMRDPISLGYLLARASDTLADTALASVALRRRSLDQFRSVLVSEDSDEVSAFYLGVVRDFCPRVSHEGEKELLQRLPEVIEWLNQTDFEIKEAVVEVLGTITGGQCDDLVHFETADSETLACLESGVDLERYTYQVAGCVGEFWTRIGFLTRGSRFAAPEAEGELCRWGRSMGQGLQLVNILRDLGEDLREGRCYLPAEELREAGWQGDFHQVIPSEIVLEVARSWQKRCRECLEQGWDYVSRLKRGRARFATALPLILAEETLSRVESAGTRVLEEKVKVGRSDVRRAMARAATC